MVLTAIAPDLWTATQSLYFLGLDLGSRMTTVRLPSGKLVVISPIKLNQQTYQALNDLGPVGHIIAPNLFHYLSVGPTQSKYPNAQVYGTFGLKEKCPDLCLDRVLATSGSFEDTLDHLPFKGFKTFMPSGVKPLNEIVFYHRPSQTLILTDVAYNFDQNNSLSMRLAAKVFLGSYKTLKPSRLEKLSTRDKGPVEDSVQNVLAWDFDRVIPGHGSIVETGGKAKFKRGYDWFLDRR